MTSSVAGQVRSFVVETFLFGDTKTPLPEDGSLIENGLIDSTGILGDLRHHCLGRGNPPGQLRLDREGRGLRRAQARRLDRLRRRRGLTEGSNANRGIPSR